MENGGKGGKEVGGRRKGTGEMENGGKKGKEEGGRRKGTREMEKGKKERKREEKYLIVSLLNEDGQMIKNKHFRGDEFEGGYDFEERIDSRRNKDSEITKGEIQIINYLRQSTSSSHFDNNIIFIHQLNK